jgi:MinD superfamily P-loop ATPase
MEIPYDRRIAEAYSEGIPFVETMPQWKEKFLQMFETIKEAVR